MKSLKESNMEREIVGPSLEEMGATPAQLAEAKAQAEANIAAQKKHVASLEAAAKELVNLGVSEASAKVILGLR